MKSSRHAVADGALRKAGLYDEICQAFAVLLPGPSRPTARC